MKTIIEKILHFLRNVIRPARAFNKLELIVIMIATIENREAEEEYWKKFLELADSYSPTTITSGMYNITMFNTNPDMDLVVTTARMIVSMDVHGDLSDEMGDEP